jgi:hypothetical protein
VKLTGVPEQAGNVVFETILTLAETGEFTVIVPPASADPHPPLVVTV